MSVTTTTLGANTVHLAISGETSVTNFINALDAAIVNGGWSQVDVSNPYNRIYSAPNADGVTVKYIGINIDPGYLKISTTSYESWNATTHVGTNQTWTFNRAGAMGFAFNFCDVLLFVNSRWLILQSFIRNQPSCWSGVIELAREAPEDTATAGYPCWCWVSSATIMTQIPATTPVIGCVSFPRTVSGATGAAAATVTSLQTPYTRFGASSLLGQPFSSLPNYATYAWNTADKIIHSIRPVVNTTELHGRMFGLKMTYNIGSPFSQVSLPIDSNYAYSAAGTQTTHWVLGGYPSTTPQNLFVNTANYPTGSVITQSVGLSGTVRAAVPVGVYFYVGTSVGVYKVDASSTAPTSLGVITGTSGKDMQTIEYDNYQYVYVGGPDGLYRIDTLNNDTVTFLAVTGGISGMWWDGTYLWAGLRTAATTGHLLQINPTTFTIANTINLGAASAAVGAICSDNAGNTYALTNSLVLYKVVNSSLTVSSLATSVLSGVFGMGMYFTGDQLILSSWNGSGLTYKSVTLSGTTVTSTSYNNANQGFTGTIAGSIGKIGVYDFFSGNSAGYSTPFLTDLSGVGGNISYGAMPLSSYNFLATDYNRAYSGNGSTFYYYTNMFRPDDQTTSYGRFLLPQ